MKENNKLASIVLFAEKLPIEIVEQQIKLIVAQTYLNKEVIVFYDKDREDLEELIIKYSFQNCKFIPTTNAIEGSKAIKDYINGSIIFYKTCNPIDWLPRHIEVHMGQYQKEKIKWLQSLAEYKDSANPDNNSNTLQWRLQPPNGDEFEIDEISHIADIILDWDKIFDEKGSFHKRKLLIQLGNGNLTNEISIVRWFNSNVQAKNQIASQLGQPNHLTAITKENHFPTILGNIFQHSRNQEILQNINKISPDLIESIVIKRIAGMGDVIMTQPIQRYLRKKYPKAKISLMTSNDRGASDAAKILGYDNIILVDQAQLTQDALMNILTIEEIQENIEDGILNVMEKEIYNFNDYQIKIDLDLSYESRHKPYLMSYFELIGVKYEDVPEEEKLYKFILDERFNETRMYYNKAYLHKEGSGWQGKTYPDESWNILKEQLKDKITFTEGKYFEDFNDLLLELSKHDYYIGTDSGIMHLALGLGLKCFVIAGAALPEFTAMPYVEKGQIISIQADIKDLPCLGCKHKMFFEIMNNNQITFVSPCKNNKGPLCMTGLDPMEVSKVIEKETLPKEILIEQE